MRRHGIIDGVLEQFTAVDTLSYLIWVFMGHYYAILLRAKQSLCRSERSYLGLIEGLTVEVRLVVKGRQRCDFDWLRHLGYTHNFCYGFGYLRRCLIYIHPIVRRLYVCSKDFVDINQIRVQRRKMMRNTSKTCDWRRIALKPFYMILQAVWGKIGVV